MRPPWLVDHIEPRRLFRLYTWIGLAVVVEISTLCAEPNHFMTSEFETVFDRLRTLLRKHAQGSLVVSDDRADRFCLEGKVGPATVKIRGGKLKAKTMPVAWVQIGKAYVSYHHMAFYGSAALHKAMSPALKKHMQGKTCFNFKVVDEPLFEELDVLTARGNRGMVEHGFIA